MPLCRDFRRFYASRTTLYKVGFPFARNEELVVPGRILAGSLFVINTQKYADITNART